MPVSLHTHDLSLASGSAPGVADHAGPYRPLLTTGKTMCLQRFSGDVDIRTAMDFAAALDQVAGRHCDCVVLELSEIGFLGASGLAIMARFLDESARQRIPVALVCGRPVARPIEACLIGSVVSLCESLEEAESALVEALAG